MTALQVIWFLLIALLLVGYTLLDGYDLGVGFWMLFTRSDADRRTLVASIGPVWDGNEVFIITAGAALFAAFPPVYATVFSSLYFALMLVLLGLILRGVSIEFGAKATSPRARDWWDLGLGVGSTLVIVLYGVALGNILRGLPLDAQGNYTGSFFTLLHPFALLVGLLNLAMLAMYGGLYVELKTEGDLAEKARSWTQYAWISYFPLALITIIAAAFRPQLLHNYLALPVLWVLPVAALFAILFAGVWNAQGKIRRAFLTTTVSMVLLLGAAVAALFPIMVPALGHPAWNLTVANSSATPRSLHAMLIIALIGLPIVIVYIVWIHRIFGGKVKGGYY